MGAESLAKYSRPKPPEILGLLLAGGQARRLGGGDKCLIPLGGKPLLSHVIARARPQVGELILNANGDPARFKAFGLPVIADVIPAFAGPLAGVLTGMAWAALHRPEIKWIASFATDTPFFPNNLIAELIAAITREGASLACATSDGRDHPVFGLWPVALANDLRQALTVEDIRKVRSWTARHTLARADFNSRPIDPFFNINTAHNIAAAEEFIKSAPPS